MPALRVIRSLAVALAMVAVLMPGVARAYCRATTCDTGVRCSPPADTDCGVELSWKRPCIGVSVHSKGSIAVSPKEAQAVLLAAFGAWEASSCGGLGPGIHVEDLGFVSCGRVEYNSKAGNANTLLFHDDEWPHASGPHNIALTTVTFDTKTGEIFDADIEVNSANYTVTITDVTADYDLSSVLVHEAGHFLGLAHSELPDATMFAIYTPGTTDFRSLSADDASAICAAYPPHGPQTCNPIPRHGFASECGADQVPSDCSFSPGNEHKSRAPLGLAAAALFAAAWRSRRRSRVTSLRSTR